MIPTLVMMAILIGCSAFFSASEAALFYLRRPDRRILATGGPAGRVAERLLHDPDRLLSAVLFWNLVINILYFTLASIASLQLQRNPDTSQTTVVLFAVGSLLAIIFFSEMLPKSVAVLRARSLASFVGIPLATAVRAVDPIMPVLRRVTDLSKRIVLPSFEEEMPLDINDMTRAIEISTEEKQLLPQEQQVLHNVLSLSELPVQEWMRPRSQFKVLTLPSTPNDRFDGDSRRDHGSDDRDYVLLVNRGTLDITWAISSDELLNLPTESWKNHAEKVACIPWCATVADAFQEMQDRATHVAVVVNEHGDSIGIITEDDVLDAILNNESGRDKRLRHHESITELEDGVWQVEGMTTLSRLARHFDTTVPESRSVTLGGIVQEMLERLPETGDECRWGPFCVRVTDASDDALLKLSVRLIDAGDQEEPSA